jgi:lysophospholipase L1-like esterase
VKQKRTPAPNRVSPSVDSAGGSHNIPAALTPRKRRTFAVITLLLPVLAFGLLELALRLVHYGPDLSLFTTEEIAGTTYHIMSPQVKLRYFPRGETNATTSADYFVMPKTSGTYRIFCLGGSTTAGYPYWYNGSFSSFLRERLHRTFPAGDIQVINLGMTATNSFTVLDMARELTSYEPDLLIVYDGHNEFYGALGVASRETVMGGRFLTNLYLILIKSRVFLLLRQGYEALHALVPGSPDRNRQNITMESLARDTQIPYGSQIYNEGRKTFEANLKDLRELCRDHAIPIILSSQVSNLRGCPPFVSRRPDDLRADDRQTIDAAIAAGETATRNRDWEAAIGKFRIAAALDSLHAGTHFAIACCLDIVGHRDEARREYLKARDFDQLRFRTSGDFNRLIAGMEDSTIVGVADMERVFMAHSPDSLIGNELMLEHVHPNSRGYFLMAREYAAVMHRRGLLASPEEWARNDTIPETTLWKERQVTEVDERIAARRTAILTAGWPFVSQQGAVPPLDSADTLGRIVEHFVEGKWGWVEAHQAAVSFYAARNERDHIAREYATLRSQVPQFLWPNLEPSLLLPAQPASR